MLFNSKEFLLYFLPFVVIVFYLLKFFLKNKQNYIIFFLVSASLFFYGYFKVEYLLLIIASILINYYLSVIIIRSKKKFFLFFGILFNVLLLAYFKYTNFAINSFNIFANTNFENAKIVLPLAISFFTFQQITYLVDSFNGIVKKSSILNYFLFVTFFPQLIAGPIVHHSEMMPQFEKENENYKFLKNFSMGLSIFIVGLFKKNCLADNLGLISDKIFSINNNSTSFNILEQWIGCISYSLQIYFDFSAYSDMAIGLALIFGITLPINFNSPYKSCSIIEYWKRWHITLSRFINQYLFYPLSMFFSRNYNNQIDNSILRLFLLIGFPTLITFSISGLWHGASWTFVIWGMMHGIYVFTNFIFKNYFPDLSISKYIANPLTLFFVFIAWIPFRAENISDFKIILFSLFGVNSSFSKDFLYLGNSIFFSCLLIILSFIIIYFFENSSNYFKNSKNIFAINFDLKSSIFIFILILGLIFFGSNTADPFIYFQF